MSALSELMDARGGLVLSCTPRGTKPSEAAAPEALGGHLPVSKFR